MWLIARGAMAESRGPQAEGRHRFFHVPASNTAVGHLILENQSTMSEQAIKVALAGAGAFGIKHLDGIKQDRRRRSCLAGRPRTRARPGKSPHKYGIAHVTTDLAESLALPDVDAVILSTPTQMHAAQAIQCMQAGKHVQVEIPMADTLEDSEAVVDGAERDRPGRDVRPHAPLQSQPSVGAQEDRGRRIQDPADGRADLFLPPHQHERAGSAAQLDRSPAVAPRRPHGGSVRLSDRQSLS